MNEWKGQRRETDFYVSHTEFHWMVSKLLVVYLL